MNFLQTMSEGTPIDWDAGIKQYGGDEAMFKLMIERFEELAFNQNVGSLFRNIMKMDFKNIETDSNVLKAASK